MPTFLHVGCGQKRKNQTTPGFNTPEWNELRFDIDASVQPDLLGTMTDMAAVASASVDAIYSSHNIEHLYPHEVPVPWPSSCGCSSPRLSGHQLPRSAKRLRSGGPGKLVDAAYTSPAGPIAPIDILYGFRASMARGNLYMAHRCGFTQPVLDGTLRASGFQTVASMARGRAPFFDLFALASKSPRSEGEMRALAQAHFPLAAAQS